MVLKKQPLQHQAQRCLLIIQRHQLQLNLEPQTKQDQQMVMMQLLKLAQGHPSHCEFLELHKLNFQLGHRRFQFLGLYNQHHPDIALGLTL